MHACIHRIAFEKCTTRTDCIITGRSKNYTSFLSTEMDENVGSDGYSKKITKQTFMERFAIFEKGSEAEKELKKDNPSDSSWRRTQGSTTADSNNIRSKYKDLRVFHRPHCLIKNDENRTLSIETDVMQEISQIEDTINVIGIAGPYRSGKSYLLNRLAGVNRGFPLGNTTDAATKGIWVWCIEHPEHKEEVLMLLDTEGIGDVEKGDEKNDNDILCLTTLLCGTFVFNLLGVVNEKMLKSLSFVSKIARNIALSNTVTQNDLKHVPDVGFFLPSFVLCLRDFSLKIPNNGTPDDYLENCLKLKKGHTKHQNQKEYNDIRLSILQNFKKRRCFVFDRPAAERRQLSRLEELRDTALSKDFLKDTRCFLEYMYGCKPKTLMDGSVLNGRMLSSLVEQYTGAIKSGEMPCIDDALTLMSQKENEVVQKKAVDWFKQ
ncbi:guanylate-binding protein 1-like [Mercenaria mercenaria]|uniref:guanylate-binding protein 1-like n=1 Tax=Mercenaria mercenaria TaxID=6596 RepID=UPI00234FA7A9|nr:guanylate-binding protein 1-like [Mercenaria mercenaria]